MCRGEKAGKQAAKPRAEVGPIGLFATVWGCRRAVREPETLGVIRCVQKGLVKPGARPAAGLERDRRAPQAVPRTGCHGVDDE